MEEIRNTNEKNFTQPLALANILLILEKKKIQVDINT